MSNPLTRREQIGRLRLRTRRQRQVTDTLRLVGLAILADFVLAWLAMIGAGIVHGSWWHLVPTMNYGTAFLLTSFLLVAGMIAEGLSLLIREL